MKRNMSWVVSLLALGLWVVPAGSALAQSGVLQEGALIVDDINQGSGTQTNGDDWEYMDSALVGPGNQNAAIDGNANTGSGSQENIDVLSTVWDNMMNANSGSGSQVVGSDSSAGGDRDSSDTLMEALDNTGVANAALDASVTGNAVTVSDASSASSTMEMGAGSGFSQMHGVSAVAASTGANASQNVSVNVTAQVHAAGN